MAFNPVAQTAQGTNFSAFIGGMNAAAPLYGMQPTDCIYSYNLNANEYGMKVRAGTSEWANTVTGSCVRTILPYNGSSPKLFAASSEGIFDITTEGDTSPTKVVTWGTTGDPSGQCVHINYTNSAGTWLLVADEQNGYHQYDGTDWDTTPTPAVTLPVDEGGADVTANVVFVTEWKKRLWFVLDSTSDCFYLEVNAVNGVLKRFRLSNKFQRGGDPVGLWSWTHDSGTGVDDYLVALSTEGDCLVYTGIDPEVVPTSAGAVNLTGYFYVGELPVGRRVAYSYGGDLIVLSTNGLLSLSRFLRGSTLESSSNYLTQRIEKLIRSVMRTRRNYFGWGIYTSPKDSILLVSTPVIAGERPIQFVMDTTTTAWGFWRDLSICSAATWQDEFYFGHNSDKVYWYTGAMDNVNIDLTGNDSIEYSVLSSYQDFGSPAANKIVQYVRPTFRAGRAPSYAISALYDYNFDEIFFGGEASAGTEGVWEPADTVSEWDTAVWSGDLGSSYLTGGSFGMGRTVAIAIKGRSKTETDLVDINVMWTSGGMM